jgi:hypothetical protein
VVAALRKAGVVAAVDEVLPQAPKVVCRQVFAAFCIYYVRVGGSSPTVWFFCSG